MDLVQSYLRGKKIAQADLERAIDYLLLALPALQDHALDAAKTHPNDPTPAMFAKEVEDFFVELGIPREQVDNGFIKYLRALTPP